MGKSRLKNFNETISFIEAKDIERDAMSQRAVTTSVFSSKSLKKTTQKPNGKITCSMCKKLMINLFGAMII